MGTLHVTRSLEMLSFSKALEAASPYSSWQERCGLIEAEQIKQLELASLQNSHVKVAPIISPVPSTQSAQLLYVFCPSESLAGFRILLYCDDKG
jgi:hypothetical protein